MKPNPGFNEFQDMPNNNPKEGAHTNHESARYKLSIVAPTCFYYQVALFRRLTDNPRVDLTVYFCSDEALHAQDAHTMYRTEEDWGDEAKLLDGYKHQFLRNYSPDPSYLKWPFGLINLGIWNKIRSGRPDVVVLMSWMNITWWIAIAACMVYRIPFLYMTDANVKSELESSSWKKWVKKIFLGKLVFKLAGGFLCAGTANRMLYQFYGVPESKLIPFVYSWGYETQLATWEQLRPSRDDLRAQHGIEKGDFVILYCGRLSKEKNLFDLLEAYRMVEGSHRFLFIVGDGELREQLENEVALHCMDSVRFLGFRNRNEIAQFYTIADVLVLPSKRETWGIVVNEAMCFQLPVITSDQVGSSQDLIRDGENGFIFPSGDVRGLSVCLQRLAETPEKDRILLGNRSHELVKDWLERDLNQSLNQYFDSIH